jgi:hypothetical protein
MYEILFRFNSLLFSVSASFFSFGNEFDLDLLGFGSSEPLTTSLASPLLALAV